MNRPFSSSGGKVHDKRFQEMHTYLPSYCRGPSAKAKDLTSGSLAREKGQGKGSGRGAVTNVEEIAKSRAQKQSFKSIAVVRLVKFCKRWVWEVRGGKDLRWPRYNTSWRISHYAWKGSGFLMMRAIT